MEYWRVEHLSKDKSNLLSFFLTKNLFKTDKYYARKNIRRSSLRS